MNQTKRFLYVIRRAKEPYSLMLKRDAVICDAKYDCKVSKLNYQFQVPNQVGGWYPADIDNKIYCIAKYWRGGLIALHYRIRAQIINNGYRYSYHCIFYFCLVFFSFYRTNWNISYWLIIVRAHLNFKESYVIIHLLKLKYLLKQQKSSNELLNIMLFPVFVTNNDDYEIISGLSDIRWKHALLIDFKHICIGN